MPFSRNHPPFSSRSDPSKGSVVSVAGPSSTLVFSSNEPRHGMKIRVVNGRRRTARMQTPEEAPPRSSGEAMTSSPRGRGAWPRLAPAQGHDRTPVLRRR